mmetsp:Transcript_43132/g.101090  ORF Transcript_43132/g.101090 Transcript_43132/m.101090 type:complete len:132 (-) Transcript_43132:254-649(-)
MSPSHNAARAKLVLDAITKAAAGRYATWFVVFSRGASSPYYKWVEALKKELPEEQRARFASRFGWSAPFCWLELPDGGRQALGGRDALCEWALCEFADSAAVRRVASAGPKYMDLFASLSKPGSATAPKYV